MPSGRADGDGGEAGGGAHSTYAATAAHIPGAALAGNDVARWPGGFPRPLHNA